MFDWLISNPDSAFWLGLDRLSILLSYFVVISILAFVYNVFRYRRQRKKLAAVAGTTSKPKALALSFGGGSIKEAAQDYLIHTYGERSIPLDEYQADEITTENIHKHEEEIRRIKESYQSEGVTELHLFMKGPVALALAVGAIFDNWVSVKVYQHRRDGGYVPWTTLDQAKATPIADELAERALRMLDAKPPPMTAPEPPAPPTSVSPPRLPPDTPASPPPSSETT